MVPDGSIYHVYNQPRVNRTKSDQFLSRQGRKVLLGDGNCIFRAVSYLMHSSQNAHQKLQETLVTIVEINQNRFEKYIMEGTFHNHIITKHNSALYIGMGMVCHKDHKAR